MSEKIEQAVRSRYGSVAVSNLSSENDGVRAVAEAFGYTQEELSSIPAEANMGLSCGNPTATAHLREGETVVDLGSGGGLDVFLAAQRVGASGKAIGIDMTPEMIDLARRNAAQGNGGKGYSNVEFHLATIDNLPLPDDSVDCVISNCVINLATNKTAVFREIARVLKPGGRLAISDIALKQELPAELGNDLMAYVGCIAGAIQIEDYKNGLLGAGFSGVEVIDTESDLNAYAKVENQSACCPPAMTQIGSSSKSLPMIDSGCCATESVSGAGNELHADLAELLRRYNVNDYAASVRVFAIKNSTYTAESAEQNRLENVSCGCQTAPPKVGEPACCETQAATFEIANIKPSGTASCC
jgi:SAM-dependent methyltransferase